MRAPATSAPRRSTELPVLPGGHRPPAQGPQDPDCCDVLAALGVGPAHSPDGTGQPASTSHEVTSPSSANSRGSKRGRFGLLGDETAGLQSVTPLGESRYCSDRAEFKATESINV